MLGPIDPDMGPEEALEKAFGFLEVMQISNGPAAESAAKASKMYWLRDLAHRFASELEGHAVNFREKHPEDDHTLEEIECELAVMMLTSCVMGILIAVKEEMEAHNVGIFKLKAETREQPTLPDIPDLTSMSSDEINRALDLLRDLRDE